MSLLTSNGGGRPIELDWGQIETELYQVDRIAANMDLHATQQNQQTQNGGNNSQSPLLPLSKPGGGLYSHM